MSIRLHRSLAVAILTGTCALAAQEPAKTPEKLPVYDVASIKPNTSGSGHVSVSTHNASLSTFNVPIVELLEMAFDVRRSAIFGVPSWADKTHFDIEAKITDPDMAALKKVTDEQRRNLFLALLQDRFGLKWHFETRTLPVYELVVAKNGSKLEESKEAEGAHSGMSGHNSTEIGTNVPITDLTAMLCNETHRVVVDRTGLKGRYNFTLKWTREDRLAAAAAGQYELPADSPPSIFTATQEQLGLRLESAKDPVQALVVDQLELPTEN